VLCIEENLSFTRAQARDCKFQERRGKHYQKRRFLAYFRLPTGNEHQALSISKKHRIRINAESSLQTLTSISHITVAACWTTVSPQYGVVTPRIGEARVPRIKEMDRGSDWPSATLYSMETPRPLPFPPFGLAPSHFFCFRREGVSRLRSSAGILAMG